MTSQAVRFYDALLKNDHLSPPDRLHAMTETMALDLDIAETILLAMEAIDLAIGNQIDNSRNFYVYQDASVWWLIDQAPPRRFDRQELIKIAIILNEADLIFRFTTALKFRVDDVAAKQLRINRWGKTYIQDEQRLKKHASTYKQFEKLANDYIAQNKAIFKTLAGLLVRPITLEGALEIAALNNNLSIKLVS